MEILIGIIIAYILTIIFNIHYTIKWELVSFKLNLYFTFIYLVLSPVILPFTIGRALLAWYEEIESTKAILQGLRLGVDGTRYEKLSDNDLLSLTDIMAQNTQYIAFDSFEEIFQDLEQKGYIIVDENGNCKVNLKIQSEE